MALYCAWLYSPKLASAHLNFTYTSLLQHRYYSLLLCHFAHDSLLKLLVDSTVLHIFCTASEKRYGRQYVVRSVGLSLALGSLMVLADVVSKELTQKPVSGNDSVLRGLMYGWMLRNP